MAKGKTEGAGYKVVAPFRDKDNWDIAYEVGQDVSDLTQERIAELVEKGLVSNGETAKDSE
ncbi:hypothetical protein [Pedobacter faecalis]|uniref:hypothetical protein n=1 Tax=Pedobacter faecalis TaxID=3041495 RepID=UPI00254C379F|nr:hypothetical protein [Pedobacter sp. ELA7]